MKVRIVDLIILETLKTNIQNNVVELIQNLKKMLVTSRYSYLIMMFLTK